MKCLHETKLLCGDIVLSTEDHYVSKAIRTATKSDISHAMIYVARCSIIDSTGEGVHARNTQRLFFADDCAVYVRRLAAGLSEQQRDLIVNFVRSLIGTRYSKLEAIRAGLRPGTDASRQQYCSRLAAQAYASVGIQLVDSVDYCTPDELKNSSLLIPVEDAVISVPDEHVASVEQDIDTNDLMREVTNRLLDAARSKSPGIESIHDIDAYLVSNPADDEYFAKFYDDSGYLSAWQAEFDKNRWQYEFAMLAAMPGSREAKRHYCMGVIADHGEMLARREGNRVGYTILHSTYNLRTFRKLERLYQLLVDLQFMRRRVAFEWLQRFAPDALPEHATSSSSLVPHTEDWFAVLFKQNRHQAQMTRRFIELGGSADVCTFCGDMPARDYKYTGQGVQVGTVLTCKLCDDCLAIRKVQFDEEYALLNGGAR
jgi:hypothetical protein